jgi:hypothetical protein
MPMEMLRNAQISGVLDATERFLNAGHFIRYELTLAVAISPNKLKSLAQTLYAIYTIEFNTSRRLISTYGGR